VIAKDFILAKDFYRIGVKILRGNKILRDHHPRPRPTPSDAWPPEADAKPREADAWPVPS
jgi:hypothetical protein